MQIYTRLKPPPVYLLRNKEETSETNYSIVDVNWATLNCLGFASIQKYSTEQFNCYAIKILLGDVFQGRLNHDDGGGAWCPRQAHFARLDYLEIDLLQDHVISAVVIQGRFANGLGKEFATHFMVKFWKEGYRKFEDYRDQNGEVLLGGNVNTFQPREQQLDNMLVIASKIRLKYFSHSTFN